MESVNSRVDRLVELLSKRGFSAIVVPSNDSHFSEYVASYYKCREYITGFDGSAGTAVITTSGSALWCDSRYFLQAEQQLEGSSIELMKMSLPGTPSIAEYLLSKLKEGDRVAVDASLYSAADFAALQSQFPSLELVGIEDVFSEVWSDRPSLPKEPVIALSTTITGESLVNKLAKVRNMLGVTSSKAYLISALDEIAWLLNIRGNDISYNPVVISYCSVESDKAILFVDKEKVSADIEQLLLEKGVEVREYNSVDEYIASRRGASLICNSRSTNCYIYNLAKENGVEVISEEGVSAISRLKSIKNENELDGFRRAMIEDGVALVRFNMWLEEAVQSGGSTSEIEVAHKLEEFRAMSPLFRGSSFSPIVGYKSNGAIVHYSVTPESSQTIVQDGFLLMDSGGQYECGTTDITRTIHLSTPTEQEKIDFTLVLQGNIDLSNTIFFRGTRGSQLDILARRAMLAHGVNYLHGTGHGVGHYLNVHEGPQSIRMEENPVVMECGMVTSNEPAMYRTGEYGIRTENVIAVVEHDANEFGEFLKFETLTLFPIETRCVEVHMLTVEQRSWLNNYHIKVYDALSSYLSPKEQVWLALKTKKI